MMRLSQLTVGAATRAAPQLRHSKAQRPSRSALAFRRGAFPDVEACLQSCNIPTRVPVAFVFLLLGISISFIQGAGVAVTCAIR
jgi:hypothetical protein